MRKRLAALAAALAVCALVRVWLIAHTEVIARDGTIYVRMARLWPTSPGRAAREFDYPVGYPAAVAGVHAVLMAFGAADGIEGWDLAGQIVSLAASVAATAAVWAFAGAAFGWRAAWVTGLLFGLTRRWAELGADVLSDALALGLQLWAAVLALGALDLLRRGRAWAVALAAGVGLAAGLGYLVRPESLFIAAAAVALWTVFGLRGTRRWGLSLAASGAAVAATAACVLPYAIAIGGLTKKKALGDLVAAPGPAAPFLSAAGGMVPGLASTLRELAGELADAMHPALALLALAWTIAWFVARRRPTGSAVSGPAPAAAFLAAAVAIATALIGAALYRSAGYLSHRHVMFAAALLSPVAGAGLLALLNGATARLAGRGGARLGPVLAAVAVGGVALGLALHTLRPLHPGKAYYRRAAERAARLAGPRGYVATDSPWVLHYAQVPGECLPAKALAAADALARIERSGATHLALSEDEAGKAAPGLFARLVPPGFTEVDRVDAPSGEARDAIRIWTVNRPAPGAAGPGQGPSPAPQAAVAPEPAAQ